MTPALIRELRARVESVAELASWHADPEVIPGSQDPQTNVAHASWLITRECQAMLALLTEEES